MVGRTSRRSVGGRETLPEVRKWSRDPSGFPEVVGRTSRRSVGDRETLPEVRKWSETISEVWNW